MYTTTKDILTSGLALGKIKVLLEVNVGLEPEAIELAIDKAGIRGKRSNGFASDYYSFLTLAERTEAEAKDFINGKGAYESTSPNVKNHLKTYLNVFELVKAVRATYAK